MNNKLLSIIIIITSFLIIIGIVYFLLFFNREDNTDKLNDNSQNNQGQLGQTVNNNAGDLNNLGQKKVVKEIIPAPKEEAEPASEAEIKGTELVKIASAFAERWGSYSNHSDFNNLNDLKIFMTETMSAWVDTVIEDGRAGLGDTSVYQGLTTKSISAELQSFSDEADGRAVVLVKTQKTAKRGDSSETTTSYEDVLITFVKEGNDWKVGRID